MKFKTLLSIALLVAMSSVAFAELQNVEIGGSLRIRGNYFGLDSLGDVSFIEQRTRLNVKADFTQEVSAFIELDSYDVWGEDFRSMYICGNDMRGTDNVDLYQAYIEARNMWDTPLSVRVGRQELALGNQWLVGVNDTSSLFYGLSFDALRVTFANDVVSIDAIAAKLAENYGDFGDNDVDLYALYGSYLGIEDVTLDAYWMFIRDDAGVLAGLIDGTTTDLHTFGLRGAGVIGGFDFELEAAYQIGDVEGVPSGCWLGFGEAEVDFDSFAVNMEMGYTFDASVQPRIFARFAYLGGGDDNSSCWRPNDRDLPFNRLFSNVQYSEFLDDFTFANGALSNVLVYSLGIQMLATEALELKLVASYLDTDNDYDTGEDALGWEVGAYAEYNYSEDLAIRAGYAHFFGDEALEATPVVWNGLRNWGGDEDDDYDYLFLETEIAF
ncbi:MAG: alginate export family protein [Candidatus Hydrogenedentes bacterium]|jgi:opacity protein-like surface antigen|nr:alginate export family protein [Candidatus Hydrogenedentota bacterium]